MAHIWQAASDKWGVVVLDQAVFELRDDLERPVVSRGDERGSSAAIIRRTPWQREEAWVLMCPPEPPVPPVPPGIAVRVNGDPVRLGLRVLNDRDLIRIGPRVEVFFSSEVLARVEAFAGESRVIHCARCTRVIEKDSPSVRCPQCKKLYHQADSLLCWTYEPRCGCGHPTALDAGYRWTPEEL